MTLRSIVARKALGLQKVRILLELFGEDGQLNVYGGELEVRPPGAPTSGPDTEERGP